MQKLDALNNPLIIGKTYGYSSSDGSWITVVTGELVKINEKKVTLKVLSRRWFLYGKETSKSYAGKSPSTLIHPAHLFPVELNHESREDQAITS